MSHRIQLTTGTFFDHLSDTKFIVVVRGRIWNYLMGLISGVVFLFIPYFMFESVDKTFFYVWYFSCGLSCVLSLYRILYFEKITVDIKYNHLIKQKCLAGLLLKQLEIKWYKEGYYLNENVFDSYNKISSVWFIAKSDETKQSKRLIEFASQNQYNEFIKVLKEHFPELIIREWHD